MNYFSFSYAFALLPAIIILYSIVPKKFRPAVLLVASYAFFWYISGKRIIFLLLSCASVYISARLMKKIDVKKDEAIEGKEKEERKVLKENYKKKKRLVLILTILFNLSFLFFFKYLRFFATNTNSLLTSLKISYQFTVTKYLAPIGISYYTLKAISYLVDVYNEKCDADKNILRVSLYLSFFPEIMEGPFSRYSDTANSLYEGEKIKYQNFCFGYQRIFWGFFKKLVIANRLNSIVRVVFDSYATYSGVSVFLGIVAYTIMLYMDFSGAMDIVIGTGEIFNVKIPENFKQPFFAKNISEFWTRWHITLGTWFKDYIFYPVSLSKPMKKITISMRNKLGNHYGPLISGSIALFAVWLLNGLWHGAGWNYIFFGLYHFFLIVMANIFSPLTHKLTDKLHIKRETKGYRIFESVKVTLLVFIGECFFRAETVGKGFAMLGRVFTKIGEFNVSELSTFGLDIQDYFIIILAIIVIFGISLLKEKGMDIRQKVANLPIWKRWTIYYSLILATLIFGAYGTGYVPADPIYVDF